MISEEDLREIKPAVHTSSASHEHVRDGVPIPKAARIRTFSPDDWEQFVEEWATSLNGEYAKVRRLGAGGDRGVDIAGFSSDDGFNGPWDNYQCKRYDHPLHPGDVWIEIGKIVHYSHVGAYTPPRRHYFICSRGIGTSLEQLLNKPDQLKRKTKENWEKHCCTAITETTNLPLTGDLETFFDAFDFTVFSSKSTVELIDGHAKTAYHAVRFGGGLPLRPHPEVPPAKPAPKESRYLRQILDAYGDRLGTKLLAADALADNEALTRDYLRQRERFYHAEALRNFARDTVPHGTFDDLQDEVFYGVVDTCDGGHPDGFERMSKTISHAAAVAVTSNPLASVTKTQDKQGICHQLANDDRLNWVPDDE